ncbi:MAG TPA: hypothetical protein VFT98_04215 [Myxococcota bacterium]|nr:hypothetical protein [Myxococcota bacterium]
MFCVRSPAAIGTPDGVKTGALVMTEHSLRFFEWIARSYSPLLAVPWPELNCAWLGRWPLFADRWAGVEIRDHAPIQFAIGTSSGSNAKLAADAVTAINVHIESSRIAAMCSEVRSPGPYRDSNGVTFPDAIDGLERWTIRRLPGHPIVAIYDGGKGVGIELTVRTRRPHETLESLRDGALAPYRALRPPNHWSERPSVPRQLTIGGASVAALATKLRAEHWLPGHRMITVAEAGPFALVADVTYGDTSRPAERLLASLLRSIQLPGPSEAVQIAPSAASASTSAGDSPNNSP